MRLKKLKINGFKSFADKVTLDFDCEIVGVVGPNGCGKSNIVDAFRWVMGEQSAKSMRGDKMHDVLFAGTDSRKPLGVAEVSVTFTDVGDALPTAYDEITITRRLHRSGESEYLMNKQPARLRDIQGLFLGSGIGKNAFSIFEQGKLDQIIHLSPLDRRGIFDEAAGTSRFLQRKKESVRKLSSVSENYNRIHDVHAEVEKQTKQLKKQANQAHNYQENKKRLQGLERGVLLSRWHALFEKNASLSEKHTELAHTVKEKQRELEALEAQRAEFNKQLETDEQHAKHQNTQLNQTDTRTRILESEINQLKQQLLAHKKREQAVQQNLSELARDQQSKLLEVTNKEKELLGLSQDFDKRAAELEQHRKNHKEVEQALTSLRGTHKKNQTEHLQFVNEERSLNAQLQKQRLSMQADLERLNTLKREEKESQTALQELEKLSVTQKQKVEALAKEIEKIQTEINALESTLQALQVQKLEQAQEQKRFERQQTEMQARQSFLQKLKEEFEGFSSGAKVVLKEAQNKKSALYQKITPLFEHIVPKKGFEDVLGASMRPYIETLVVQTEEDLKELLEFAESQKIHDFSVINVADLKKAKKSFKKQSLASCVELNQTACHFTQAIELVSETCFLDALGVYFSFGKKSKKQSAFSRESELKSLSDSLLELQKGQKVLEKKEQNIALEIERTEKKRTSILEMRRKKEMHHVQENFSLQQALNSLDKTRKTALCLEQEKSKLISLEDAEKIVGVIESKLHKKQSEIAALFALMQTEGTLLEVQEAAVQKSDQQLQKVQHTHATAQQRFQSLDQELKINQAKQQQIALHEKNLLTELEELKSAVVSQLKTITHNEQELDQTLVLLKKMQLENKQSDSKLVAAKKQRDVYEKELVQLRKQLTALDKQTHTVALSLAQDSSVQKNIEEELLQRHALAVESLQKQEIHLEHSIEETEKQITQLKASLDKSGAVNLTAIAEFEEQKKRFDYLDSQLKDLESSREDLEKIIAKLDQENRKIFKKTFAAIRTNFQKNFEILFKGGSADLTFTESSDILEAGIEIVAKPPGKQMRSISLLSGGEKCLTALALLFSIFEVRPAPFCILDEVDAPLDDTNIDRFTEVLQQFIEKTQFIIVTHNKKTMAIADLLVGVSMEEKGVSKLLSLAFEKSSHFALS
ncbi:MAG: Chromosome partition protein Smc [Chlamydiales bacterium]|nr:Chromosome partition protein Smc [Chlamydiales bacterium]